MLIFSMLIKTFVGGVRIGIYGYILSLMILLKCIYLCLVGFLVRRDMFEIQVFEVWGEFDVTFDPKCGASDWDVEPLRKYLEAQAVRE